MEKGCETLPGLNGEMARWDRMRMSRTSLTWSIKPYQFIDAGQLEAERLS